MPCSGPVTPLHEGQQEKPLRITLIVGTNRAGSRSLLLTRAIQQYFIAEGVDTQILDLQDLPSEVLAPTAYGAKPANFDHFSEAVLNADGLYLVVPEYNGSYPGVLKLFIDLLPFPESFEGRPVAFTGIAAGQFGNLRGIEHLQAVFGYRNAFLYPKRIFIPGASSAIQADGTPTDAKQVDRIKHQVKGFIAFIKGLKGTP